MSLKITTLIEDNLCQGSSLDYEHGLSLFIEVDGKCILFDTGQSNAFIGNSKKLNIDLQALDSVIISHGHYDHSGGLKGLIDEIGKPFKLIVGQSFFDGKYKNDMAQKIYIGNAFSKAHVLSKGISVTYVKNNVHYVSDNIMLFSNFKTKVDFEETGNSFYIRKNGGYEQDQFLDEIVLAVRMDCGLVVITGCSHNGIVNILETIRQNTGMHIYSVIGGIHLIGSDYKRIKSTINYMKSKNINKLVLMHCTGSEAISAFKQEYKDQFIISSTGSTINLP